MSMAWHPRGIWGDGSHCVYPDGRRLATYRLRLFRWRTNGFIAREVEFNCRQKIYGKGATILDSFVLIWLDLIRIKQFKGLPPPPGPNLAPFTTNQSGRLSGKRDPGSKEPFLFPRANPSESSAECELSWTFHHHLSTRSPTAWLRRSIRNLCMPSSVLHVSLVSASTLPLCVMHLSFF